MISTGKSDWEKEVTEAKNSLAFNLNDVHGDRIKKVTNKTSDWDTPTGGTPGIFHGDSSSRLAILNGSHRTTSESATKNTVLIFPDYKLATEVDSSVTGAEALWEQTITPAVGRAGKASSEGSIRSWTLPYQAVLLLCAHV